ncbi:MAG: pyridoxamine 5'-phosphate oxidase family protein [Lapillicoccus sp.]
MNHTAHPEGRSGPVVVGCDASWPSAQAVIAAARTARRRNSRLTLLAVERAPEDGATRDGAAAERARSVAETARAQAHSTEPAVLSDVVVVTDVRDRRVDRLASEASVLVLGAYGGGGQVALSLGSTSEALSRAFDCPILLPHARVGESLRAGSRPPLVVAAVSRDDTAHHVVAAAAREAAERHVPLLVVHAIAMRDAAHFAAEQDWVAAVVRAVGVPAWLPHRTVVTVADPVAAVLDRVESDDLLVTTTRGQGRLAGLVAGSVTRALLDAGLCDVLVVSHGAAHLTSGLTPGTAPVRMPGAVATLSDTECWSFLRGAAVGRLGVAVNGRPDIFPVNHVVDRERVVFRTAQGSKLDACVDQSVAYEVDGFDTATGDAWSVVVKGTARELRERDEVMRALRLPITPWPGDPKPRFVQIDPDPGSGAVTGRRFHVFGGVTAVRSSPAQGWLTTPDLGGVPVHA